MKIPKDIDAAFATLRKHVTRLDAEKKSAHATCEAEQKAKGLPVHHHTEECSNATMLLATINMKLHKHAWSP